MNPLAARAAALLAADPLALGGAVVRGPWGPERDVWLDGVRSRLAADTPWLVLPATIDQERLDGGVDLVESLKRGTRVAMRGLLEEARGGIVLVARPDRLDSGQIGSLLGALDDNRCAAIVLDESGPDDPPLPSSLVDRLGLLVDLRSSSSDEPAGIGAEQSPPTAEAAMGVLCRLSQACGIGSLRPPLFAIRAAARSAALAGRAHPSAEDLAIAAQLVLAPRALRAPEQPSPAPAPEPDDQVNPPDPDPGGDAAELEERVVAAVRAVLPADLLAGVVGRGAGSSGSARGGPSVKAPKQGRTIGARRGDPRRARLHWYRTMLAAAPWQSIRRRARTADDDRPRLLVRRDDLRVRRLVKPMPTTTIFVVDASGSAALHRLNEAKGAVEHLLARSYVRRDQVALIVFRKTSAELLLPPTRSLTRARRVLAGIAGGGGTPLAAGLALGAELAERVRRGGARPMLVVLTDGRANVARSGATGRPIAESDSLAVAREIARAGFAAVVVDVAPRPNPFAASLAATMASRYLPLPFLEGERLGLEVKAASEAGR